MDLIPQLRNYFGYYQSKNKSNAVNDADDSDDLTPQQRFERMAPIHRAKSIAKRRSMIKRFIDARNKRVYCFQTRSQKIKTKKRNAIN